MPAEFWNEFGKDLAIRITPSGQGRVEVYLDGQKLFDRKEEKGAFPDYKRVGAMRKVVAEKLSLLTTKQPA